MKKVEPREYPPGQRADRRALAEITDLIDDGVYEAASVTAWEVQRDTPGDPAIWLLLTRIDYLRERYAAAMYAARMATRLDPSSAQGWLWLARTGATRARWRTEGLDAALQATALAPDDPRTWTALAELHLVCDAPYEAAIAAERAVRVGPDDVDAYRMLGAIALRAEEWRHAVAAFRQALRIAGDDDEARAGLAQALQALNIDPSSELHNGPVRRRQSGAGRRFRRLAKESEDLAAAGRVRTRRRGLLLGVAVCVAIGAVLGFAAPGIGVTRGLAAAGALVLMWVAIWPLRRRPRSADAAAGSAPADGGARSTWPARSATRDESTQPEPASTPEPSAEPAAEPAQSVTPEPATSAQAPPSSSSGEHPPMPPVATTAVDADPSPSATAGEPAGGDRGVSATASEPVSGELTNARSQTAMTRALSKRPRRLPRPPQEAPPSSDEPNGLPDDPGDLVALTKARLAEFDLESARAAATRLAAMAPDSLEAHRALAAVALAAQDYPQAEWHYGKVLEIEPLDQEAHERLALARKERRREERGRRRRG
jgi:tetratricopeptide (TPR) repeat protein